MMKYWMKSNQWTLKIIIASTDKFKKMRILLFYGLIPYINFMQSYSFHFVLFNSIWYLYLFTLIQISTNIGEYMCIHWHYTTRLICRLTISYCTYITHDWCMLRYNTKRCKKRWQSQNIWSKLQLCKVYFGSNVKFNTSSFCITTLFSSRL